jgi:hypothetical protein
MEMDGERERTREGESGREMEMDGERETRREGGREMETIGGR